MRRTAWLLALLGACTGVQADPVVTTSNPGTSRTIEASPTTDEAPGITGETSLTCWSATPQPGGGLSFQDETTEAGLTGPLVGIHGHAALWADVDADGQLDLMVGTFADRPADDYRHRGATGPSPDRLLLGSDGGFTADPGLDEMFTRTSGGTTGDFDGDGDLDLLLVRNDRPDLIEGPSTQILRNEGGVFEPVAISDIPSSFGGRSAAALDYDEDGLLDLFIVEDRWSSNGSILLHNEGDLTFTDATSASGLPTDVSGLGVAVADLDDNGLVELFVAGSNRLFSLSADSRFTEVESDVFTWETHGVEDDVAGVSVADVDRDGRLDIVLGQHFNSTVDDGREVAIRLYLNRSTPGSVRFDDVTDRVGLLPLPTKAPHVELNDVDNDGWPDIITSASAGDGTQPAIFKHEGLRDGLPVFSAPEGLGSAQYWVSAPTADVNRDGLLDLFLLEWEPSLPSRLLINQSGGGHWLEVSVDGREGFGIGWRVEVWAREDDGSPQLIGARDITTTQGYAAGVAPIAHFGLGEVTQADVVLRPPGEDEITLTGISADQHIRFPEGCG